jgi:glycosyltransferase involved in cell wall biosynthesis
VRVLILNDWGVPRGGAEVLTLALRNELRGRGHEARVFTSSIGGDPGFADHTCRGYDPDSRLQTLARAVNPAAARSLRRVLAEFDPDVVHVRMCLSQLSPVILPLLRDVPAVYHAVIYEAVCPTLHKLLPDGSICEVPAGVACWRNECLSPGAWPVLMAQRAMWKRWRGVFDVVVANSHATRRRLLADGIDPVEVLWNGVAVGEARGELAGPPTVGFAGRLTWPKGVDVLVRAFALAGRELPEADLVVAGDGEERGRLECLAAELGIEGRVRLLGHLPHSEAERALSSAWVQAVPSRYEEPFGLVAAEAMMRGTAVVASRIGGLAEVVEHERTGLLVEPGDEHALADAFVRLLSDRELADRMGRLGRERALAEFTIGGFTDGMLELYEAARA